MYEITGSWAVQRTESGLPDEHCHDKPSSLKIRLPADAYLRRCLLRSVVDLYLDNDHVSVEQCICTWDEAPYDRPGSLFSRSALELREARLVPRYVILCQPNGPLALRGVRHLGLGLGHLSKSVPQSDPTKELDKQQ